jgi:hypothetical protein
MDPLARTVLDRLPLAEAVLFLFRWIADEPFLADLFERGRGRCYEKLLTFPNLVHLLADALLEHHGSARPVFEQAHATGELPVSIQAAYKKLGRLPVAVSQDFLAETTVRLQSVLPVVSAVSLPACLQHLQVTVLDGKAIKRVPKRLKPLRHVAGGLLGGRALVALSLRSGLAVALHAEADGEANDVRFVADLLPQVRQRSGGLHLWVADRQFCTLKQLADFVAGWDHFLVRYHANVTFQADTTRAARSGQDARGRTYQEEWGWLGRAGHRQRRYVRRLTLQRAGDKPLLLVTDLLDADRYPAADLLEVYWLRWGIERMFQQVTEVFGLSSLIGSTPEATVFQFSFCLVLYNVIQVLRAYVATAAQEPVAAVSTEKLFEDVTRQLIAWREVTEPAATVLCFEGPWTAAQVRERLQQLLGGLWKERWRKAPSRPHRPTRQAGKRTHGSVFRILQEHRQRQRLQQKE